MRLDAYRRVSRVNGREGESFISPDVQREKIAQWAQLRGVEIAKWHEPDLDQSGGKLSRPHFDEALARVQAGETGGIVVSKLDRFSRAGVADALKLIESIHEAGGQVASVEEGFDPTTAFGEFGMTLMLGLARMQRRNIGDSWSVARERAVARGIHVSSMAPTGYRRSVAGVNRKGETVYGPLEKDPKTAPFIEEVFKRKAAGASWNELALYLRENNVESPYGTTQWMPRALAHVCENRVYVGEARSGEFVNENAHQAIIDDDTWIAAQKAKGQRSVNGFGGALLAGVLRCEGCGYALKADTMLDRGTRRRNYRCRGRRSSGPCPAPASVLGSVIEPFVVDRLFAGLSCRRYDGTVLADDLRDAEDHLQRAEHELETYVAATSAAGLGGPTFADGARQRQDTVDAARAAVAQAREKAGVADLPLAADLEGTWPDLDVRDRNQLLRASFDGVMLGKGRVPIQERTMIYWRGEMPVGLRQGRG